MREFADFQLIADVLSVSRGHRAMVGDVDLGDRYRTSRGPAIPRARLVRIGNRTCRQVPLRRAVQTPFRSHSLACTCIPVCGNGYIGGA